MLRLDLYLVQKGFFSGREKAKRAIIAGRVLVNRSIITKASFLVEEHDQVTVTADESEYVSRGGYKLAAALENFSFSVDKMTVLDLGSSTGGFTDCLLKNGAKKIYAVDVGTNQLVPQLRENPAVVVMEQTNARNLSAESFPDEIQLVTADLSFISLRLVFPAIASVLPEEGCAICLVKPQFEAGKGNIGKNGVVRDSKTHRRVLENLIAEARMAGLNPFGLTHSPITGGDGNIEFLLGLKKTCATVASVDIAETVTIAHKAFRKGG